MATSETLEYQKNELTLDINSFDKPKELANAKAWAQLMLNLIFLKPGTYPSLPEMGVGLEGYQYEDLESAIGELNTIISSQQKQYLPQIPVENVNVSSMDYNGQKIIVIQMAFTLKTQTVSSVVAVNASYGRNFLDFDVSW